MNIKNKAILVTGGCGFIGSHLCERLCKIGIEKLIIVDDLTTGKLNYVKDLLSNENVKFVQIDVMDPKLSKLTENIDIVFHLAARNISFSVEDPFADLDVNIKGTLNILNCASNSGVEKFIYASSASVYGQPKHFPESEDASPAPLSLYGVSKLSGEYYTLTFHRLDKLNSTVLRYFNIYGPRQYWSYYGGLVSKFIYNLLKNKAPRIYGDGTQTRDFTYIDDCIDGTIMATISKKSDGKIFNIASGKEITIKELAMILIEISKKNIKPIYTKEREIIDKVKRRVADIEKAKKLLGYKPKTPIKTGLNLTFDWFKNNIIN